ncbi:EAL domain-containing protein [Thiohalocapsa marina]|uniref:cyclic-guanylate-specific phosphodiesterase n=1 Tax=Thiohalocapsa marina TaxID=424902 RepID=A0A5M8FUH3_9GAMM|nr:EAL domain-containing protein [Thiohalocapsa marina]KAA6187454.1 EAL domain-containing protein [Thiohalocapsa marina]
MERPAEQAADAPAADPAAAESDEQYWKAVLEAAGHGVWDWDIASNSVRFSRTWKSMLGYADHDIADDLDAWVSRVHPDDLQDTLAAVEAHLEGRTPAYESIHRMRCKDGGWKWILDRGRVFHRDAHGQALRLIGTHTDITERLALEEQIRALNADLERRVEERTAEVCAANAALRESEERFRRLFEDTRQPLSLMDAAGRFIAVNQATLRMLGLDHPGQLIGGTPDKVSPPTQPDSRSSREKALEMMQLAFDQGAHGFEWEHLRANGECFPARILLTAIDNRGEPQLHVVWSDLTVQKQAQARVEYLAYHDELTGLPNRVLGQDRLQQLLAGARNNGMALAVLYLDLDQFKFVNDTHGHAVGNRLFKQVAERLDAQRRAADGLCRLAGDEFILVIGEVALEHAVAQVSVRCEQILASLADPFRLDDLQLFASLSIGIALYPQDGTEAEVLMRNAETALSWAKAEGPHSYRFFESNMNAALLRFVDTREALHRALEHDELVLHYQPQLDLHSGWVVGVEALLRWQRPGVGLVPPGEFIPVAEESGLIVPMGRWVLAEACRQAAALHAAGWPALTMAVNLSAIQFRQRRLEVDVAMALEASGLDPRRLELELTESVLLHGESALQQILSRWSAQGIQLAIDDFGTGYSGLAYLKRLRVNKLKIDRGFVADLQTDAENRAIVQAMIQLAQSFGLKVLAEGVEDAGQLQALQQMGCDQAQGHFYAEPLPAAELMRWLRQADSCADVGNDTGNESGPSSER